MAGRLILAFWLGTVVTCLPGLLSAQEKSPGATVATRPEVILSLVDPDEKVSVWQNLRLQFSLTSGSLPSGIGVKSISLSVPSAMALSSEGGKVQIIPGRFEPFVLKEPGERLDLEPVEIVRKGFWESEFSLFSVLAYRPRKEVFVATLTYEGLADRKLGTKTARLELNAIAHPLGMYAGAILGSFLAAVFLILPPLRATPPSAADAPSPESASPLQRLRDFVIRLVRGTVVTGMAVLILQTTAEFALPINITVHDFYGGVLIGLFGDRVAAAISKWIWGT
jgi:hypothetical protein